MGTVKIILQSTIILKGFKNAPERGFNPPQLQGAAESVDGVAGMEYCA